MKSIILDTGPVISLALNNLLWILAPLKKKLGGKLIITQATKRELVDVPLNTKRFKFEALQVQKLIEENILTVYTDATVRQRTADMLKLANAAYVARKHAVTIVQQADMAGVACCAVLGSSAYVVDERTTRILIEDPQRLRVILSRKIGRDVEMDRSLINKFHELAGPVKIIRSVELVTVAFELGLLDKFITKLPQPKRELIDGLLWGLKLNGCSVSKREINQIIKEER